jgi:hypothetical protein
MKNLMAIVLLAIASLSAPARAEIIEFEFDLTGFLEVPPVTTPAMGFATVILDTDTGLIVINGAFEDLTSPAVGAHLHGLAGFGQEAGIILPLDLTLLPGGTAGTFEGSGNLTPGQVGGVLDQRTYINVHSAMFPDGELRGQVVPAPGVLALLPLGLRAWSRRR